MTHASYDDLCERIRLLGPVLVALSGGVDSRLVLQAAADALGPNVLAVTAVSGFFDEAEADCAREAAAALGVAWLGAEIDLLSDETVVQNTPDRCYRCKRNLFARFVRIAEEHGLRHVAEGSNRDDDHDYRPGLRALRELGIQSPLRDAGFGKQDVRDVLRRMGIGGWDRPSGTCRATRFPYGTRITRELLQKIGSAESLLACYGFPQVRVRHFGETARIEVPREDIPRLIETDRQHAVARRIRQLGYTHVTLDLEGYRQGNMNRVLSVSPAGTPGAE